MLTLKALLLAAFIASTPILSGAEDTDDVTIETVSEDVYESPTPPDWSNIYLAEHFDNARDFEKKWVKSTAKKEGIAEDIAKYDGEWSLEGPQKSGLKGDLGLVMKSKAKHAAIASKLLKPFVFNKNPLVVQYEVLLQDGQECGGSYLKLLTGNVDLGKFHDKTPYSIMFGPDKCGNDHKLHFIFNHKNPLNGSVTEKHCKKPKERIEEYFSDRLPHLYTLILNPDNTFEIRVDNKPINSGNLLEDFEPPVNPPKTILDPEDKKPEDWDDREKIPDPTAVKPEDWDEDAPAQIIDEFAVKPDDWLEDEPVYIPDPKAVKPEDWDDSMDGVWEPPAVDNPKCEKVSGCGPWKAPMVDNPNYKGKWRAPMIDNPNYKGKWKAREIPNPDYYNDSEPFKMFTVTAIGFELWSMSQDILFDNILITDSIEAAEKWAADSFDKKRQKLATESESVVQKIANVTNEHPWLWFVYIGVLVLVVLLLVFFCQKPAAKDSRAAGGDASETYGQDKKKTDEATEDDKEPLVNEKKDVDDEYAEKNSDPDDDDDEEEEEEEEDAAEPEVTKETARKRNVQKD